ncbi:MAG: hypothetical protein QM734_02735 [Cyclobacteriaceae bacterium]
MSRFFTVTRTMAAAKKRVIKSLENLSEDLRDLMRDQYPNGYESSITRITNAKNEPIFVFPLETDDSVYLVKVPATKNSDGGYDVESGKRQEFEETGEDSGEDFSSGGDGDDFEGDNEYEGGDDEGGKGGREASYDPDFDN